MRSVSRAEGQRSSREGEDRRPEWGTLEDWARAKIQKWVRELLEEASSIGRLRAKWQLEFKQWNRRRLEELEVAYVWADGVYVKAGLEDRVLSRIWWKKEKGTFLR